jgi:type I restriction enzyme S subunit
MIIESVSTDLIPETWFPRSLTELCSIISSGTPPKSDPTLWAGDIPWVSGKDLKSPDCRM